MKLLLATVGKLKEKYFAEAQKEYLKRLSRFAQVTIYEGAEEKSTGESAAAIRQVIQEESRRLTLAAQNCDYKIALSPDGVKMDSQKFAALIRDITVNGVNSICFFIGGSYGLSEDLKAESDKVISFSDMTFAHQLFRILLLEQVYRAFKINANETYHK